MRYTIPHTVHHAGAGGLAAAAADGPHGRVGEALSEEHHVPSDKYDLRERIGRGSHGEVNIPC